MTLPQITNIFVKIQTSAHSSNKHLNEARVYSKLLRTIASRLKYTVLKSSFHKFKPTGFTGILLLSESHISVHTWPEQNFVALEMVTCKPFTTKEKKIMMSTVKEILKTNSIHCTINV